MFSASGRRCCWPAATPVSGSLSTQVVPALLAVARRFVSVRGKAWRVSELDDPSVLVSDFEATAPGGTTHPPVLRPPVGWILQDDGQVALGAAVPLGVLEARQAHFVAAIDAPVVITPWRSLLVCDLADGVADASLRVLAPLGLVFDENSPWLRVSSLRRQPGVREVPGRRACRGHQGRRRAHFARSCALCGLRTGLRQSTVGPGDGGDG